MREGEGENSLILLYKHHELMSVVLIIASIIMYLELSILIFKRIKKFVRYFFKTQN